MIIEQHYDDEVLIGLLKEAEEDSHVPACDTCAGTLESYRDLSSALNDGAVWDEREVSETPSPKTANFLRSFAERTRVEDAVARPIVAKLIADPTLIEQHPEWRTAGVVRGLLAYVDSQTFTDPQENLKLGKLIVEIAESLPSDATSIRLRASTWHELGYALYATNQFVESLEAYEKAEQFFRQGSVFEFDVANVALHRAQVYSNLERLDEAVKITRQVRGVFAAHGATKRVAAADGTEAYLLIRIGRHAEALEILRRIAANPLSDEASRAFAYHNSAECLAALSRFEEAKEACVRAIADFERLRLTTMRSRARWVLGRILLAETSFDHALPLLQAAKADFEEFGLHHEVALISVDTAETFWSLGRTLELVQECRRAMDYFAKLGLAYSPGALTALAYLKEAAENQTLTKSGVTQVRQFFDMLPKQPHLLFAFPL